MIRAALDREREAVRDTPHARREGPVTSHLSAHAIEGTEGTTSQLRPNTTKHATLAAFGEGAELTSNETSRLLGKRGVHKRISDLKHAELIEPVAQRIDDESGRLCIVWRITERGSEVLTRLNRGEVVQL